MCWVVSRAHCRSCRCPGSAAAQVRLSPAGGHHGRGAHCCGNALSCSGGLPDAARCRRSLVAPQAASPQRPRCLRRQLRIHLQLLARQEAAAAQLAAGESAGQHCVASCSLERTMRGTNGVLWLPVVLARVAGRSRRPKPPVLEDQPRVGRAAALRHMVALARCGSAEVCGSVMSLAAPVPGKCRTAH